MPIVIVEGKELIIPSWEEWKEEAIAYTQECISIFQEYFVNGELQEINLVIFEGYITLKVVIDNKEYDINPAEFRWINVDGEEKERLKEGYYAEVIWTCYYASCLDNDMILHLEELRDCLEKELEGIKVIYTIESIN